MTRWALEQVRHSLYAPLDVLADLGVMPPVWLVLGIVALDKPLVRALHGARNGHGVSGS
jgi:hypothetical protein